MESKSVLTLLAMQLLLVSLVVVSLSLAGKLEPSVWPSEGAKGPKSDCLDALELELGEQVVPEELHKLASNLRQSIGGETPEGKPLGELLPGTRPYLRLLKMGLTKLEDRELLLEVIYQYVNELEVRISQRSSTCAGLTIESLFAAFSDPLAQQPRDYPKIRETLDYVEAGSMVPN